MKKYFAALFFLFAVLCVPSLGAVSAEANQVKVISNSCSIFKEISTKSEKLITISFGEILDLITSEKIIDGELSYYHVRKNGKTPIEGYVLTNCVVTSEFSHIEKKLDPNSKILNPNTKVYISAQEGEDNRVSVDGSLVELEQYEEVKIIDGYNKKKEFTKIMFEQNGVIYTGFVKTSNLVVDGFNATIILIVFVFLLVASIVLSIVLTTRKKRKKNKQKDAKT